MTRYNWKFFLNSAMKANNDSDTNSVAFSTNDLDLDKYISQTLLNLGEFIKLQDNDIQLYINMVNIQLALRSETEEGIVNEDNKINQEKEKT